jgi:hypothetical protein
MTGFFVQTAKIHRPRRVTLLALAALAMAAWNGLRLGWAISFSQILHEYEARPGPLYIGISGAIWLVVGFILAAGLWLGRTWAWYAAIGSSTAYSAWVWFDRLVLEQSHANWPFILIVTLVCLCIISILLFSRKTSLYFKS